MIKRLFDICASAAVLIVFLPVFVLIGLAVVLDSRGGMFYRQERVGLDGRTFRLFKFRTMHASPNSLQITVGDRDPRVTRVGYFLRKYKLDEFPQLINILRGEMSVVGPRPEVPRYVALYTEAQRQVLSVRPGLTDFASLEYVDESEQLARSEDPEKTYIQEIMPHKLQLNLRYIREKSLKTDLKIIVSTVARIIR